MKAASTSPQRTYIDTISIWGAIGRGRQVWHNGGTHQSHRVSFEEVKRIKPACAAINLGDCCRSDR